MRARSRPRGFALLIVMVLAVAMVVVAGSLTLMSGQQEIGSTHSGGAELARVIAESGLARADAWAIQALTTSGGVDFDRVLDPGLEADCTGLDSDPFNPSTNGPLPRAGGTTFLPVFQESGVDVIDFPAGSGRRWRRVPQNRGAYLVRYEDNTDDSIVPGSDWSERTGNNPGIGACDEGPGQGENLARDRDGAIWAQVMGIYPGINPSTAVHRVLLRKLIRLPAGAPGASAFSVKVDIGDRVGAENNIASLSVGGNVTSTEGFCGRLAVRGTSSAKANSACSPDPNPFIDGSGGTMILASAKKPEDGSWYDWTSPCNFYVDPSVGLFFWDAGGTRGGVACNSYVGDIKAPNPAAGADPTQGACWVPLLLRAEPATATGNSALAYKPFEPQIERQAGCAVWKPLGGSSSAHTDPGSGYQPDSPSADETFPSWFAYNVPFTVPDFSLCSVAGSASELRWPTGTIDASTPALSDQSGARVSCGTDCDGTRGTLKICPDPTNPDAALQLLDNAAAYVTGVVYKAGNYNTGGTGFATTPEPTSVNGTRLSWPMFTLLVQGRMTTSVNEKLWFGVGTKKGNFPSLVVGNGLEVTGSGTAVLKTLGGLQVTGDVVVKKKMVMYGPVAIEGSIEAQGGGDALWDYDYDFLGDGTPSTIGPSSRPPHRTLRMANDRGDDDDDVRLGHRAHRPAAPRPAAVSSRGSAPPRPTDTRTAADQMRTIHDEPTRPALRPRSSLPAGGLDPALPPSSARRPPPASLDPALPPARPRARTTAHPGERTVEAPRRVGTSAGLATGSLDPALPPAGAVAPVVERPARRRVSLRQTLSVAAVVFVVGAGVLAMVARLVTAEGPDRVRLSPDEERAVTNAWRAQGLARIGDVRDDTVRSAVERTTLGIARSLGERLGPRTLRVVVVEAPSSGELLGLPDGTLVITTGLLARLSSEAELAALLTHAAGHVLLGHVAEALAPVVPTIRSATASGTTSLVDSLLTPALHAPTTPEQEASVDALVEATLLDTGWDVAAHARALKIAATTAPAWASAHGVDAARVGARTTESSGRSGDADYRSRVLVPLGVVTQAPPPRRVHGDDDAHDDGEEDTAANTHDTATARRPGPRSSDRRATKPLR
jgi:hypothetical protein